MPTIAELLETLPDADETATSEIDLFQNTIRSRGSASVPVGTFRRLFEVGG